MLFEYHLKMVDLYNNPVGNAKQLVRNFFDKEKYILHYENLHLYLRLGLKLKRIIHVLEFSQSRQFKRYIEFNTKKE